MTIMRTPFAKARAAAMSLHQTPSVRIPHTLKVLELFHSDPKYQVWSGVCGPIQDTFTETVDGEIRSCIVRDNEAVRSFVATLEKLMSSVHKSMLTQTDDSTQTALFASYYAREAFHFTTYAHLINTNVPGARIPGPKLTGAS